MIVDDDYTILEFMQLTLVFAGYDVRVSTTGRELQKVEPQELPDLLLLDVRLIDEDGRAICKRLKANQQTKEVPIIMLSAHVSERKLRAGCPADDVLAKPFDLQNLTDKVEQQLSVHC